MSKIPLVDLQAAHAEVAQEVEVGFKRVLEYTAFIGGEEVAAFEREYAAFTGVKHCVGVANGTDAIELALRALGVTVGDEVIIPANTFIATAEAVVRCGARPVLVDMDPDTFLMDTDEALNAVRLSTKVIMPVHLYGQLAEVEKLRAGLDGVTVVEDGAQSQGATRHGAGVGAGGIAATSFYPGKNLGAYGDAGAVITDDEALATMVRTISSHGGLTKYVHDVVGVNSRLDALQAVVLRAKLARLERWNADRRAAAARYDALLEPFTGVTRPVTLDGNVHVWHLYVVRVPAEHRDAILAKLNADGIGAGLHYPIPVHLTPAFADLGYGPGSFPHAEKAATEILSLPLYPQITAAQQERVVGSLKAAFDGVAG
jgi:dTDP-4-amino-4,6-dideoxygalactose transaminase